MKKKKKVPVIILNGFLGSGKTTLFRNLLSQAKQKDISVCAIVNDMSELDVDGELLGITDIVEKDSSILESIHSCVLSSKKGIIALNKSLERLLSYQNPELIIIETSGSCHPMPLVQYFENHQSAKLTGLFVLVDSLMLAHDYSYGESLVPKMQNNLAENIRDTTNLLVEQMMFCSHLLLTKADRIQKDKLPHIASYIKTINPFSSTHSVHFGKLAIESLFELEEYDYHRIAQLVNELTPILETEEGSDRPYDLATRVIKDDRPFHPKRLWETCHQYLGHGIYRSKGFFWLASRDKHSLLWNQAAGSISLEIIGSWRAGILEDTDHGLSEIEVKLLSEKLSKESGRFGDRHCDLTVIGDKAEIDQFTNALKACFLENEEIQLWRNGHSFEDPWPKNLVKLVN